MPPISLESFAAQSGVAFGTSGARGRVIDMSDALCWAYTTAFLQSVAPESSAMGSGGFRFPGTGGGGHGQPHSV